MENVAALLASVKSFEPEAAGRAVHALRTLARRHPSELILYRKQLLTLAMAETDLRVRWNLIQIVGKLPLTREQHVIATDWLFERTVDRSPLTRTFALQALFDRSTRDVSLRKRIVPIAIMFAESGTPAMRARARKLLRV